MCVKCKRCIYKGGKMFVAKGKKTTYICEACSGEKICNICWKQIDQDREPHEKMPGMHKTAHWWVHSKCLED